MHVKARMTAFSGLLLALSVVCMALGSVIETNTLFLLAAASYFVGIIIREFGMKAGVAFYLADIRLGFLVTPNKFYVISFAAMGFYILAAEGSWRFLGKSSEKMQKSWIFWVMKYVVFNVYSNGSDISGTSFHERTLRWTASGCSGSRTGGSLDL